MNLENLTNLKLELDTYRPIDRWTLQSLLEDLTLKYTYNSNAIEGNTLTISETKHIIEHGITIGGKTIVEHLEVINHDKAVKKLINDVQNKVPLDLKLILDYHAIILHSINDDWAGRYRNQQVYISGAKHIPTEPHLVYEEMQNFIVEYKKNSNLHPIECAALVHANLVHIHPFLDGNGRTARLMMNLELMKAGYPIVIINVEDKKRYCDLLDECHIIKNYDKFIEFIAEKSEQSLNIYLNAAKANARYLERT